MDLSLFFQQITADISITKLHSGGTRKTKKKPKQGDLKKGASRRKKKSGDSKEKSLQGKHNKIEQNDLDTSKDKLEDYVGQKKEDATCPTLSNGFDSHSEDNIYHPQDGNGKEASNCQKELGHEVASTDMPTASSDNPSEVYLLDRKKGHTEETEIEKTVTNDIDLCNDDVVNPAVASNYDQKLPETFENTSALNTSSKSNTTKNIPSPDDLNSSPLPGHVKEEQTSCNGDLNQQSTDSESEHAEPLLSLTERLMRNHRSSKKQTKSHNVRSKDRAGTSVKDVDIVDLTNSQSENDENVSPVSSNDARFKSYR